MKSMEFTTHANEAETAAKKTVSSEPFGQDAFRAQFPRSVGSNEIDRIFEKELSAGRSVWACLKIILDGVELEFWHPAELQVYCDVFALRPFPTARTLAMRDTDESRLNRHWLSRLPKEAKAPKFRERFLAFVASEPRELVAFRQFYAL